MQRRKGDGFQDRFPTERDTDTPSLIPGTDDRETGFQSRFPDREVELPGQERPSRISGEKNGFGPWARERSQNGPQEHTIERYDRTQRDVQQLLGRRGSRDDRAVLWGDIDELIEDLSIRFQATRGGLIRAFGGLPETEIGNRITSTIAYAEAEANAALAQARAELDAAKLEIDAAQQEALDLIDDARAYAETLTVDLGTRFDKEIPKIETAQQQIDDFALDLAYLASRLHDTDQRVADAGIYVDPDDGTVRIAGFEQVDNRLSTAEITLDAVNAEVNTKVTLLEVNEAISNAILDPTQIPVVNDLSLRLSTVETNLSAAEAAITNKAAITTVDGIDVRLQTAETEIDALEAEILLKVATTDFDALTTRMTGAEIAIDALDVPAITQTVYDSRSVYDELDEQAFNSLADLMDNYLDREEIRQDLATARTELAALVSEDRVAIATQRTELLAAIDENTALIEAETTSRASEIEAVASDILSLETRIGDAEASISDETFARTQADLAFTASLNAQIARIDGNESAITQESAARVNADQAIAADVSALEVSFTTAQGDISDLQNAVSSNTAAINSEAIARANADSSIAANVTTLSASFSTLDTTVSDLNVDLATLQGTVSSNTAAISNETIARANAVSSLVADITSLSASVGQNASDLANETLARASGDSALTASINSLSSRVDQNETAITNEQVARVNADNALSTTLSTLSTDFNGLEASVTEQAVAIATIESFQAATYTLRLGAGGASAGLEIVAANDPINGPISAFRVSAENILLDGSVLTQHLGANSVTAEKINVTDLSAVSATLGTFQSAQTGARVVISTDRIDVYDANDVLRVRLGRLV
jgi:hypothetical protein